MKVVVIGGTGLIGSKLTSALRQRGQEVYAASPNLGVDTLTGKGLSFALAEAKVVFDVTNSPTFEDVAALAFFETSSRNILEAETAAGVKHHIALSIVGIDSLQDSGYFRGKLAQERMVRMSGVPYTILRSTQFFEFMSRIADHSSDGKAVRIPPVLVQPTLSQDVANALADLALGSPINGTLELAGPEEFRLDELVRMVLSNNKDPRKVIADTRARYFGANLKERSLIPGSNPQIAPTRFKNWLSRIGSETAMSQHARRSELEVHRA
jgi:uncharacterized protein YbjT (DUF2867 family)